MDWVVGMTAYPRTPPTIGAAVDSLLFAGWPEVLISVDGAKDGDSGGLPAIEAMERVEGVRIDHAPSNVGPWRNFLRVLSLLLESEADYVLIAQDDVLLSRNARPHFESMRLPCKEDVGALSLYCASPHDDLYGAPQWKRIESLPAQAYGALAYVFPFRVAESIAARPPAHGGRAQIDVAVGKWCRAEGLGYWVHCPSLVKHVGEKSTLHNFGIDKWRQCGRWMADAALPASVQTVLPAA